jgi:hypothetical protein
MAQKNREAGSQGLVFDEPTLSNVSKSEPLVEVLTANGINHETRRDGASPSKS